MAEIKTKKKTSTKIDTHLPKKWNVIFYNDDKTPMEFVIAVLNEIFKYDETTSRNLTMKIHESNKQIVGTYNYEIAEQRASETILLAKNFGYPLKVEISPE